MEAGDYCEEVAREIIILAAHKTSPGSVLNAMDSNNHQFIDTLIENEQKMVIGEYVVQVYLKKIWEGQMKWPTWKMIGTFLIFVLIPPVWKLNIFCLLHFC